MSVFYFHTKTNIHSLSVNTLFLMVCTLLWMLPASILAKDIGTKEPMTIRFKQFSSRTGSLPCDETSVMMQDGNGIIWIGTRLGLNRYDGFTLKTYKNDIQHPLLFTSANIISMADDGNGYLWLGTFCGVNRMDKATGAVRQFHFDRNGGSDFINSIFCNGHDVWIGNDNGLYLYDGHRKRFRLLKGKNVPTSGIKTIYQDRHGFIWVGTREKGLFRYQVGNRQWVHLSPINKLNSAKTITEDDQGNLWVGSYGCGLVMIQHPYGDSHLISVKPISAGNSANFINTLAENHTDHSLWIGTTEGLTIRHSDGKISNYPDADNNHDEWNFLNRGVNCIITDKEGQMWMCVDKGGVVTADVSRHLFSTVQLLPPLLPVRTDIINGIVADNKNHCVWMGLNYSGIAMQITTSGHTVLTYPSHAVNGITEQSEVNNLFVTKKGTLLAGTRKNGILIYQNGQLQKGYDKSNCHWLKDNCVYGFADIGGERLLAGTWCGLCLIHADGSGQNISHIGRTDISKLHILNITCTGTNDYWLALIFGIVHATGDISHPEKMKATVYTHEGKKGIINPPDANKTVSDASDKKHYHLGGIFKILKDRRGYIWACTSEPGLLQYDCAKDAFMSVSHQYGIRGDNVHSMEEDKSGDLWMSTNYGIARLHIPDHHQKASLKMFTIADGLPDNYYGNAVSCSLGDGRICFANNNSITIFNPQEIATQHDSKKMGDNGMNYQKQKEYAKQNKHGINGWGVTICLFIVIAVVYAYHRKQIIKVQKIKDMDTKPSETADDSHNKHQYIVKLPDIELTDNDRVFIQKCTEAVQQHLADSDFDQQQLMTEVGTSHATLYRKLKTLTGMDATAFIRSMRLKTACSIMEKNPDIRISDLAYNVGFSNPKYFATCFKNEFGLSPSEYIEKNKIKKD